MSSTTHLSADDTARFLALNQAGQASVIHVLTVRINELMRQWETGVVPYDSPAVIAEIDKLEQQVNAYREIVGKPWRRTWSILDESTLPF